MQMSTEASTRVANTQPAGIGRVATVGGFTLINNLGRDVSVFNRKFEKIAVFDETIFPGRDLESQFDLDAHALLVDPRGNLWFVNHYGLMRVFDAENVGWEREREGPPAQLLPFVTAEWAGDVERFGFVWPYLLSSSPKGYSSPTGAHPGVLISEKLDDWLDFCGTPASRQEQVPLRRASYLEDWDILSGLAVAPDAMLLAVAARDRVGCFRLVGIDSRLEPADCLFECKVDFDVTFMEFDDEKLVVAGPAIGSDLDQPDWDQLSGGGWALIDCTDGTASKSIRFDISLAWGNGSDPLAVVSRERLLFGFDRKGNIHAWSLATSTKLPTTLHASETSKGIAHAAVVDGITVVGFNRDGYRLHKFVIGEL